MDAGADCRQTSAVTHRLDLNRMRRDMPGDTLATRSLDEPARQLRQRDSKPELAPRSAPRNPNPASVSNTFAEISGVPSDARSEQLGISPPTSAPSRQVAAARPAVGILLYLVFIGLVATVIIVVCFGAGFFCSRARQRRSREKRRCEARRRRPLSRSSLAQSVRQWARRRLRRTVTRRGFPCRCLP
jgi:cobalamin biosynthesis Mg chelatase CobN